MKTEKSINKKIITAALIITAFVLALFFFSSPERGKKSGKERPAPAPESAAQAEGQVTVDEEAQRGGGIVTETLRPVRYTEPVEAYGTVLGPSGLIEARSKYVSARAALVKAEAALAKSKKEYERLRELNQNNKNISDRALQAAQAVMGADSAAEVQAREDLQSAKDALTLQWGPTLRGWIINYSPGYRKLVAIKEVLVQVTLPPEVSVRSAPAAISIGAPGGLPVPARFIMRAPGTDPRIQGISFIYLAPSCVTRLVPGMNVAAYLPSEKKGERGFVIPLSSVVWLQGKAWAYIRVSETGFTKVEVPTAMPVRDGYFVTQGFRPGSEIVVRGTQALLSKEGLPPSGGGGGEED
ncbi:MAG: hypothetical protein M0Z59_05115 [Nitrospiraceae bacterium]|nr:hypothetical protein [Nitrospiraceae bacterium]